MQTTPDKLTTSESLMLDVVRISAAIVVASAHLSQPFFGTGWTDATHLARASVAVFFVLSGFVIRYVTRRRPGTLQHYFGDRASRIYSVALPALLLTLITDSIARHVNPAFYAPWEEDYSNPILHILLCLLFLGQVGTHITVPLSNSPYWSVNFEVAYYILYGCFFYLAGKKRWLLLAGVALFYGTRIIYLAPLWIAGCLLCDLYQRWNRNGKILKPLAQFSGLIAILVTLLRFLRAWDSPTVETGFILRFVTFSRTVHILPYEYIFGIAWCPIFLWLLLLARQVTLKPGTSFVRTTQFIAEGTFPLYLIHFPLFVLAAAVLPYNHSHLAPNLALLLGVITLGILAGHPCNLFKDWMRKHLFNSSAVSPAKETALVSSKP